MGGARVSTLAGQSFGPASSPPTVTTRDAINATTQAAAHLTPIPDKYSRQRWRRYQAELGFPLARVPGRRVPNDEDCCLNGRTLTNGLPGYGPDAFVVGAQKGGTSWLHVVMSKLGGWDSFQCDVDLPGGGSIHRRMKEVHFWDSLPVKQDWFDDYLRGFPPAADGRVRVDSSPSTSCRSYTPCRIKSQFPNAKIIFLLREPADRALSNWLMNYGKASKRHREFYKIIREDLHTLTERQCAFGMPLWYFPPVTLKDRFLGLFGGGHEEATCPRTTWDPESRRSYRDCFGCDQINVRGIGCYLPRGYEEEDLPATWESVPVRLVARGMYAPIIAWWLEYFPPEQILVINSKTMKDSPAAVATAVSRFLGSPHVIKHSDLFEPDGTRVNFVPFQHDHWADPDSATRQQVWRDKEKLQRIMEPLNRQLYLTLEYYGYNFTRFPPPPELHDAAWAAETWPEDEEEGY